MILSPATPDDRIAVRDLHTASWRVAYAHAVPASALGESLDAEMAARWDEMPPDVFVARDGGRITGFVRLMQKQGWPYIDNLHIHPDLRGQGVGRALMGAAVRHLQSQGEGRLWLTVLGSNTGARAFYTAMAGFEGAQMSEILLGRRVATYPVIWAQLGGLKKVAK